MGLLIQGLLCAIGAAGSFSPADLSGGWQLFVDDALIAEKANVTRTYHVFTKDPGNPVLRPEKPWEGDTVYVYGTVLPAEASSGYRMWYHSWAGGEYRNLYATSADGLRWEKPALGTVLYDGNKENNILFRRTKEDHNPQVIATPWDGDRPYKLMNWDYGRTPPNNVVSGYYGACSTDGIHWVDMPENPVLPDPTGDVGNFVWDPHTKRYIGYPKQFAEVRGFRRRCVGFSATSDFAHWPAAERVLSPDEYDDRWVGEAGQHTDFYGLCGFAYESMYLGFLWIFRITDGKSDGPIFVELVSSRDGVHWTRQVPPRSPILPLGPEGAWDDGMIFTVNHPLVEGDSIKLYYGGFDGTHGADDAKAAIGLATLRKDGFVSLDAAGEVGVVLTKPFESRGGALAVNYAAPSGRLQVEALDKKGGVLPGYAREDCEALSGDSVSQAVRWGGKARLPENAGELRLRFYLQGAALYSFNVSEEPY